MYTMVASLTHPSCPPTPFRSTTHNGSLHNVCSSSNDLITREKEFRRLKLLTLQAILHPDVQLIKIIGLVGYCSFN